MQEPSLGPLAEARVLPDLKGAFADNVENLTLTGSDAIDGTGNDLDNVLTGNSAAKTLDGGAGADTLLGGAGKAGRFAVFGGITLHHRHGA